MLNLPPSLLFFLLSVPCLGKLRIDAFILWCLLKQNVNKARPEDKAMPPVCLFPPNHADHYLCLFPPDGDNRRSLQLSMFQLGHAIASARSRLPIWIYRSLDGGVLWRMDTLEGFFWTASPKDWGLCSSEGKRLLGWFHRCTRDVTKSIPAVVAVLKSSASIICQRILPCICNPQA